MTKIVRGRHFVMAVALALVLVVSIACAKAEEKPVAPAPTAKAAPAPTTAPAAPAAVRPTHWTWGVAENPTVNFDPLAAGGAVGAIRAQRSVFDPLFAYEGPNLKLTGLLAESIEFVNPTQIRFKVRKGVSFQNGDSYSGEDFKYVLDELRAATKLWYGAAFGGEVQDIKLVDANTIDLVLKREFGPVMDYAGNALGVPKVYRTKVGPEAFNGKPVGTGPYKLVSVEAGQKVELEANDKYWRGPVFPKQVTLQWIREGTTRVAALMAGSVNAIESVPNEELKRVEGTSGLQLLSEGRSKQRWHTNYGDVPMSNESLRKALNLALNRDTIVKGLLEGRGAVMASAFLPGNMGYDPDLKPYPYDPAAATKIIKDAGLEGTSFDFFSVSGRFPKDREIAQLTVASWQAVGLKPNLKYITREQVWDARDTRTFTIMMCCLWGTTRDVDSEINWDYIDIGERADRPLYKDTPLAKELRELWVQSRTTIDEAKRERVTKDINRFLYNHYLTVFTHAFDAYMAVNNNLQWSPYPTWGDLSGYQYFDQWNNLGLKPVEIKR